jgi:hypothetical protein
MIDTPEAIDSLRNKGFNRSSEKRELLRRIEIRSWMENDEISKILIRNPMVESRNMIHTRTDYAYFDVVMHRFHSPIIIILFLKNSLIRGL